MERRTRHRGRVLTGWLAAVALTASACTPARQEASSASFASTVAPAQPCDASLEQEAQNAQGAESGERDIGTTPEIGTGYREGMVAQRAERFAVATANPLASQAACQVLADGGSAADAVVAAQFVLGLTEPQSSGLGGGGYLLYYDAANDELTAIDGREEAPAAATESYLDGAEPDAQSSGRSIGVPGAVAALGVLHERFGTREWADDLQGARELAADGFEVSPRLAASVADAAEELAVDPEAGAYFGGIEAGQVLSNPDYAQTVAALQDGGAEVFYDSDGPIAQGIVAAVTSDRGGVTPSQMTLEDIASYQPIVRSALCQDYRGHRVCGMPPSSSGGIAVLETLGILNNANLAAVPPDQNGMPDAQAVHLVSEAERLAYADRDAYVADPDFVDIPEKLLTADTAYFEQRAQLIDVEHSMGVAQPGLGAVPAVAVPEHGTSHISAIDAEGNAASLTTSVEAAFGSFHMTQGFLLNNQLTDFTVGQPGAVNAPAGGKRPRSSMSPLVVFDPEGQLEMVLGSPGGSLIIQYVVKTLVAMVDWGMDPQEAVNFPNFGALNDAVTVLGSEHPAVAEHGEELLAELRELGHDAELAERTSGLSALVRNAQDGSIVGGADPRREGVVLGE